MVSDTKQLKILLVEDDPIALMVNRRLLEKIGYQPEVAINGLQAVEMSANGYDVIFMDIGLPDIDGISAVSQIRRCEANGQKQAYIVALTAYWLDDVRDKCLKAGVDNLAAKPIATEQLLEIINQYSQLKVVSERVAA